MRSRTAPVFALVGATVLLGSLAGCSSDKPDTTKKTAAAEEAAFDWDLDFARCMRDAGHDYPDPVKDESGGPHKVPTDSDFAGDSDTCTDSVTKSRGERPVSAAQKKEHDHWNDVWAKAIDCLRKKGYEIDTSDGGWSTQDKISPADDDECLADTGAQTIGGDS